MPLILTPGQLRLRSDFYHQFGTYLSAGVTLENALESFSKNTRNRALRGQFERTHAMIRQGSPFWEAVARAGSGLPTFDLALLRAGEESGRLDAVCKLLANYYRDRSQLLWTVLRGLAYPLFLFHFAIFIMPFAQFFLTGNLRNYLSATLGVLVPVYGVVFLVMLACQGRHGETWRSILENVGRFLPVLGKARQALALARLSTALEALINAGVSIINGWELAAAASGSPALKRVVAKWRPRIEDAGETPSELVRECPEFPEFFANLYHSGEISGQLDDSLRHLHQYYQDEATRKLRVLAEWVPKLVYLAILFRIAAYIVSFWANYYSSLMNAF